MANIKCQFCDENILANANVCKHCGHEQLNEKQIKKYARAITLSRYSLLYIALIIFGFVNGWLLGILIIIGILVTQGNLASTYVQNHSIYEIYNKYKSIRKKQITSLLLIVALASLLIATNPDESTLKNYINRTEGSFNIKRIERVNLVFFSIYDVDIISFNPKNRIYIGILGFTIPIG